MTFPTIQVRYPAGPITPAGAYYVLNDRLPVMRYRSPDNTALFDVYGGTAIYDRTIPESVQVVDMKGLVPPWQNISQKGATQDGETYITSLYDPIRVDLTVRVRGRNSAYSRRVLNDWIAAWDAIQPGELSWFSHRLGRWWAQVRWAKNVADKLTGGNHLPQQFIWSAIAYDGFWRSYDCVDSFGFTYATSADNFDNFNSTTDEGLTGWTIHYSAGGGWLYESNVIDVYGIPIVTPRKGGMVQWQNDPDSTIGDDGVDAVAIMNAFTSATDDQSVSIQLGTLPSWAFLETAANDIWLRTPPHTTTPGTSGLRLRIERKQLTLSYFIAGAETVLRRQPLIVPPLPGETWTVNTSGRTYTVLRGLGHGQAKVATIIEKGTGSLIGSGNRCAGLGVHAETNAGPGGFMAWSASDNSEVTQSGYLTRINAGDQPMWDRYTLYGPGTFNIGNGPNATEFVSVGPLLENQIVQVRTDPRKRGITDLTSQPASPQALTVWQKALEDFLSFATGNNTPPLVAAIESQFAQAAPQGNVYSLLDGRFSDDAAIPPKPVGGAAPKYIVPVSIDGGDANSRIVAAGTPLRRFPY